MYAELSNFWAVWLGDRLGLENGLIDDAEEAIQNKRQSKTIACYRQLLFEEFLRFAARGKGDFRVRLMGWWDWSKIFWQ